MKLGGVKVKRRVWYGSSGVTESECIVCALQVFV